MSSSITKPDIWCDACHTMRELINHFIRGNQRQFSENIYSEDDLRSSIFGTFVVKFIACLVSPRIVEHPKNGIIAHF